ncbi:hemicentin-1-like [Haliotis asinina]|uniref:hemicentin-1-like n=1 Tax=Haliotis asinina TaxID=109174 RepID=UPI0035322CA8
MHVSKQRSQATAHSTILTRLASVVWVLSAASAQVAQSGENTILINITSANQIFVPEGDTVQIIALCKSVPSANRTALFRNSVPVTSIVNCTCQERARNCTFTLKSVTQSDSGTYQIYVSNARGHIISNSTKVDVMSARVAQGGESNIVINITNDNRIYVPEGGTVQIRALCKSVPSTSRTTLIRNNVPVTSIVNCTCQEIARNCTFTLKSVTRSESGTYQIYVSNARGALKSTAIKVDVMYAPICSLLQNPQMTVIENKRVTFNVSVSAHPEVSSVQWLYQGYPINKTNPRYSGGTSAIPPLTIGPCFRNDAGVYNFTASNNVSGLIQSNCTSNLTVYYGPDLDCFSPTTVTINETDLYTFKVNVKSYPKQSNVDWFKGSNFIDRNDTRFLQGNVNVPSLTLINVNRKDTGNYSISVTNEVTGRSVPGCHTQLTVQYRPRCTLLLPNTYEITEDSSITINVTMKSLPPLTFVDWNLNGTTISRNSSHYSGGNRTVPSLTIDSIQRRDTGFYSMHANNTVGEVVTNCTVFLQVLYRPECIILSNTTLEVIEHSSVIIHAAIDAAMSPNVVDWKLNGIPVNRTGDRYAGGNSYQSPSLKIAGITRHDAGIYTLTASNDVGSVVNETNCNVNVVVQYIDNCPNRTYSACKNGTVTLQCSVKFLPSLSNVTWKKNGVILDVSNPRYSGGTVSSPDLTISPVLRNDDDDYTCEVENVVGRAGCQITLDVFSFPDVHVPRRNILLVEGQTSSLGCSVDMRVKPSPAVVHWFKDGVHLDSHFGRYDNGDIYNPSLTITDIKREDAGIYTCGAVSGVGDNQSEPINVTVEYPPTVLVKYNHYGFYHGSNVTLWCYVNSYPLVSPTDITWVRDGKFVIPSSSCRDVRPNWRLCSVDTSTAGKYMCRARHRLASVNSEDITVQVRDMCPTIVEKHTLVNEDRSADGRCISGRLQVQLKGMSSWGTVCGRTWTSSETEVVCGMMGYPFGEYSMRGGGVEPIHLGDVTCLTGATTLNECRLSSIANCSHDNDVWLTCCKSRVTSPVVVETVPTTTTPVPPPATEGPIDKCKDTVISVAAVGGALLLTTTGLASILLREKCSACSSCGSCEGCNLGSVVCNNEGKNSLCACRSNRISDSGSDSGVNSGDEDEEVIVVITRKGGALEFSDKGQRKLKGVECMCDLIRLHECPNSENLGHINVGKNNLKGSCQCTHTPHCDCNSYTETPMSSLPPLSTSQTRRPPEQLEATVSERKISFSNTDTCDEEENPDYADIHTEDETSGCDLSRPEWDAAYETIGHRKERQPLRSSSYDAAYDTIKRKLGRQILPSPSYSNGRTSSTSHGDVIPCNMPSDNSRDSMPPIHVDVSRVRRPSNENETGRRSSSGVGSAWKTPTPTAENGSTVFDSDALYASGFSDLKGRPMQNMMPTDDDVYGAIDGHVPQTVKNRKKRNRSKSRDTRISSQSEYPSLLDDRIFRAMEG